MNRKEPHPILKGLGGIIVAFVAGILVFHYEGFITVTEQHQKENKQPNVTNEEKVEYKTNASSKNKHTKRENTENETNISNIRKNKTIDGDVITIYHNEPFFVCHKKDPIVIDIWSSSNGLEGSMILNSPQLPKKKQVMRESDIIQLSDDCILKLLKLDIEDFKPGRYSRNYAEFEILSQ